MGLPALASAEDVRARLSRDLGDAELGRVLALLDDASTLARDAAEATWVDDNGDLDGVPDTVKVVVIRATIRALNTSDDNVQSEQLGPSQFVYRSGDVYLTKAERKMIRRAAGLSGVGAITLESPYEPSPSPGVPTSIGGDLLPWRTLPT